MFSISVRFQDSIEFGSKTTLITRLARGNCMRGLFVILEISLGDKIFPTIIANQVMS